MNKKIIYVFLFLSHALIATESPSLEKKDDKFFSPRDIVFNLVTTYYLDHRSICSFGSTSKSSDRWMIALAATREKIVGNISEIMQLQPNTWHRGAWHAYGSFYRCIYVRSYAEQLVQLKSYELAFPLKMIEKSNAYVVNTGDFIDPLPCKNLPYCDKDYYYFYGLRKRNIPYDEKQGKWQIYKGVSICKFIPNIPVLECRISTPDGKSRGLKKFLGYPLILEAILNSAVVSKKKKKNINVHGKKIKRAYWGYSLEGITIPTDYQGYVKKMDSIQQTARWNLLDQSLKDAIEMHYQKQISKE